MTTETMCFSIVPVFGCSACLVYLQLQIISFACRYTVYVCCPGKLTHKGAWWHGPLRRKRPCRAYSPKCHGGHQARCGRRQKSDGRSPQRPRMEVIRAVCLGMMLAWFDIALVDICVWAVSSEAAMKPTRFEGGTFLTFGPGGMFASKELNMQFSFIICINNT